MTCLDFENQLHELFDLRQHQLPDELSEHAAHCRKCRDIQACFQRMHDAVVEWRTQQPMVSRADDILRRLQVDQVELEYGFKIRVSQPTSRLQDLSHRNSTLAGWLAMSASALALVIAIGIGWRVSGFVSFAKRPSATQAQFVNTAGNRSESPTTPAPIGDRQLDVLLHDARDAYAALATQAWRQVSTADVLLPPTNTPHPFGAESSAGDISEPLSRPLAPLGKELREAVDSWLQFVFNPQDSST